MKGVLFVYLVSQQSPYDKQHSCLPYVFYKFSEYASLDVYQGFAVPTIEHQVSPACRPASTCKSSLLEAFLACQAAVSGGFEVNG